MRGGEATRKNRVAHNRRISQFSIANPQQVLLLAEVAFQSISRYLKDRHLVSLDLASHLFQLNGKLSGLPCASGRDQLRICRVRFATVQLAAAGRAVARWSVFAMKLSRALS